MNGVAWFLLCWACLALGVLIGHFTWPRPEVRVLFVRDRRAVDRLPKDFEPATPATAEIPAAASGQGRPPAARRPRA